MEAQGAPAPKLFGHYLLHASASAFFDYMHSVTSPSLPTLARHCSLHDHYNTASSALHYIFMDAHIRHTHMKVTVSIIILH